MGFFDGKANIVHSDPKGSALGRFLHGHKVFRMIKVCLRIDCSFQFFHRRKMIHDGLCGAMQSLRYCPCVDVFHSRLAGNRKGRIYDHFFCDFCFGGHFRTSTFITYIMYNVNYTSASSTCQSVRSKICGQSILSDTFISFA